MARPSHPPSISVRLERPQTAIEKAAFVFIVDDDISAREGLQDLVESVGLKAQAFGSADAFFNFKLPDVESCLVLDVRLPGTSGLVFQEQLARADIRIPIIFVTGYADVPMSVRAMKAGAVDFLPKPFRDQEILDAIFEAIAQDRERRRSESRAADIRLRYESLGPREREVLVLATSGLLNKQIAGETGTTESTIKVHRSNVMRKMGARSFADLVRMVQALGLERG